jgi:hypothetical protein
MIGVILSLPLFYPSVFILHEAYQFVVVTFGLRCPGVELSESRSEKSP